MKFVRSKKLVFFNNKGGVGKTTLAYNTAVKLAEKGYKTVLVDLDPQCNLTRLALGEEYYANTIFEQKTIYDILEKVITGGGDIDTDFELEQAKGVSDNLFLVRGSINLSEYENLLLSAYSNAAQGLPQGYFATSAIDRFLNEKGLTDEVDIFVIDVSPSLGLLNRIIMLGSDYFVVPMMPDAFSIQGVENLGKVLSEWKRNWKITGKTLSKERNIPAGMVLDGEGLFIGYILNSYNIYGQKIIKDHNKYAEKIPELVHKHLSADHSRNGLVERSGKGALQNIQDYGRLPSITHQKGKAIFNIDEKKDKISELGTKENIEKAKIEFENLSNKIIDILEKY